MKRLSQKDGLFLLSHVLCIIGLFKNPFRGKGVLISIIAMLNFHNLFKNVVILAIQLMTEVDETKQKENYPLR
jgi:hypothetical protein